MFLLMQIEAGEQDGYSLTVTHRWDAKAPWQALRYLLLLLWSGFFLFAADLPNS